MFINLEALGFLRVCRRWSEFPVRIWWDLSRNPAWERCLCYPQLPISPRSCAWLRGCHTGTAPVPFPEHGHLGPCASSRGAHPISQIFRHTPAQLDRYRHIPLGTGARCAGTGHTGVHALSSVARGRCGGSCEAWGCEGQVGNGAWGIL